MSTVKEISIFRPLAAKKTLTKTERTILFERLELDTGIPHYHFEAFNDTEDRLLDETRSKSDIPALLIKRNIDHLGPLVKKRTSKEFHVSLQLNIPIHIKDAELQNPLVAASNAQIEVIGVMFSNIKNYFNPTRLPTLVETSSLKDKVMSGMFGLHAWYHQQHDKQRKRSKFFQDLTHLKLKEKQFVIYFKNKESTVKAFTLINAYIDHMIDYYNDSLHFMYSALEHPPLSKLTEYKLADVKPLVKTKFVYKSPLLNMINDVYTNNLTTTTSRMVLLYDLVNGKLWPIYQFAKLMGLNDKAVKGFVEEEKERQSNNKIKYDGIINDINQKNKHHKKLFLARSLFYKKSLDDLTEKELDIVNLTYQKDLEFVSHVQKNKCVHLKLLERVMQSNNSGRYFDNNAWEELKKLIPYDPSTQGNELLKCSLCDLSVLCPHHYEQFEHKTRAKGFKQKGTADNDLRLLLLKKYADKTPIEDAYFCKICGEKIVQKYNETHAAFISGQKVHITYTVDTMSNKIWKEVRGVISNNVTFGIVTDANLLTTNITDTIQPYIEDEQTRMQNIVTNTPDVIQNTVYLYISLYAYASLIRIMSHHPEDIQFKKGFSGFAKKKPSKSHSAKGGDDHGPSPDEIKGRVDMRMLQDLLKTGLGLLVSTKMSLIQKIPNISLDSIKPLFIKAFKTISKLYVKTTEFHTELPPEYVANSVIYAYLHYANNKHDENLKYSDVRKILGVELQDIENLETITDKAVIPPIWKLHAPDEDIGFYNDPKYLEMYHKYAYESFIHFMKYVKSGLHTVSVFKSIKHANHADEFMSLKKIGDTVRKFLRERFDTNKVLYHNKQHGEYTYKGIDLSKIFCPDGRKHRFDIHVYEKGLTRLEISKKNIDEWMFDDKKNKEFRKMNRVDLKCSVCGTFLSKTEDVKGEDSITSVLNRNDEVIGFYNLYTFKCPVKNIHIFEDDKCTQCEVTKTMIFKKDMAYYGKYREVFREELEVQAGKRNKDKGIKQPEIKNVVTKPLAPWSIDNTPISMLSKISKIPISVLNNIGLIEGNDYEKIQSGELNPSGNTDVDDVDAFNTNRVVHLETYMNAFLIEYEMMKNGRIIQPQLEMFVKKWDNVDFTKFPDVANDYHTLHRRYVQSGLPKDKMANFVLYSLAASLVQIHKQFSAGASVMNADAALAFVKYTMDKIVASEKAISDPGILRGKLAEVDDDDAGDAVEADYDDIDITIDENFDPFSLESTGIDAGELGDNMVTGDD
jgi:hypothetical protein